MPLAAKREASGKKLLLFCFLTALVVLTIFSHCSFLHPTNTWSDANCFYTVGKSLARGKVLYRDIYEQKGPLLYFLHVGVEWISGENTNPFLEIYFVEVVTGTLTLFFLAKTLLLYRERRALVFLPLLAVVIYSCRSFRSGDSVEEYALVTVAYTLFITLRMLRSERHDISRGPLYLLGVLVGIVFWMKYTALGFVLGAAVMPFIVALRERNGRLIGRAAAFVLLGMFTVSLPVAAYFAVHNAFGDLWEAYFYNNIFLYSQKLSAGAYVRYTVGRTFYLIRRNLRFVVPALLGWIWLFRRGWRAEAQHVACIAVATEIFCIFGGHFYIYYALIFAPLAVFGVAALDALLEWLKRPRLWAVLLAGVLCPVLILHSTAVRDIGRKKETLPMYRLAAVIAETPGATMIDLGGLDRGLYTATGLYPVCRYFCRLNVGLDEAYAQWREMIRAGEVDYIHMGMFTLDNVYDGADAPYELVATASGYNLYRRVD